MFLRRASSLFAFRRGHLEARVERDYIRNGIATIPCRVTCYDDLISTYSLKGFESLNQDFIDYVIDSTEVIPPKYPIVLDIIGDCLSEEEKVGVKETIIDEFTYQLGQVETEERRHRKIFLAVFIGLLISGLLLWVSQNMNDIPREMLFIMFWYMGDTVCDYVFLTGYDLRRERQLAGRLASVKVIFSDTYVRQDYDDEAADRLYSEIRNDVRESMRSRGPTDEQTA